MLKVKLHNFLGVYAYEKILQFQNKLHSQLSLNRNNSQYIGHLILCEHENVYTLGKFGKKHNLLISDQMLHELNAKFYHVDRGGDITYHGPGQLVGYPILYLPALKIGAKKYIWLLEQSIIDTLSYYSIKANRADDAIGVWLDVENKEKIRKISSIGVRISASTTMHGFALNVNSNLKFFNYINPCGISQRGVTSMQKELGSCVDINEVKNTFVKFFSENFQVYIMYKQ